MGSLVLKWVFLGASVAAMNKLKRAREAPLRIKKQAAGVARKGAVALAALLIASSILSAGVIIAINNWFLTYQNTGSFSMDPRVWGGIVLTLFGGTILYLAWPKSENAEAVYREEEKSELEKTIILALKGYLEEKQLRRELRRQNKTHVRSVS